MPFKSHFYVTILLAMSLLVSCSFFFEPKETQKILNYDEEVATCLSEVNESLSKYFDKSADSELSDSDIDAFTACYQEAIEAMLLYTRSGRTDPNSYSAENIESLIRRLHPDMSLSLGKIQIFITLKSFLIGGQSDSISRSELSYLHDTLLPGFSRLLKKMRPFRPVILNSFDILDRQQAWEKTEDNYKKFKKAYTYLGNELGHFISEISTENQSAQIDLSRLVRQTVEEFDLEGGELEKVLPLALSYKSLVLNDSGAHLRRSDLSFLVEQLVLSAETLGHYRYFLADDHIFDTIGSLPAFFSRIHQKVKDSGLFRGVALKSLHDVIDNAHRVVYRAAIKSSSEGLSADHFARVFSALKDSGLMEGPLTPQTLDLFLRRFSSQWLPPYTGTTSGLTAEKLNDLRQTFMQWIQRQQVVNTLFERTGSETLSLDQARQELANSSQLADWVKLFRSISLHQWDEKNHVVIYSRNTQQMTYENFTVSNSIWTLVELFYRPFNADRGHVFEYSITTDQAQKIYELFRVLGVEMGFVDSREFNSGHRSFTEANNFSTQLRNDDKMDFFEAYEFMSVAVSAGQLSTQIYHDIPERCLRDYTDVLNKRVVRSHCFRSFMKQHFLDYFGHLGTISQFWRGLNAVDRDRFFTTMELAARAGVIDEKPFDMGELRVFVSITYYTQAIFNMFDLDRDGKIEGLELREAEDHFHNLIKGFILSHVDSDRILEDVRWLGNLLNSGKQGTQNWIESGSIWFMQLPGFSNLINSITGYFQEDEEKVTWSPDLPALESLPERATFISNWNPKASREELAELITPKIFLFLLRNGQLPESKVDQAVFSFFMSDYGENWAFGNTTAQVGDVLGVFSAIGSMTREGHKKNIADFLAKNQVELLETLNKPDAPQCLDQFVEDHIFCRWARVILCNEPINNYLFQWMRENRYALFSEHATRVSSEAVARSMQRIFRTFRSHTQFSTRCNFPHVSDDYRPNFSHLESDQAD